MFERFTPDVRRAVLEAAREASMGRADRRLGTEHLLVGVAEVGDPVSEGFGVTPDRIRAALDEWDLQVLRSVGVDAGTEALRPPPTRPRRRFLFGGHVPFTRGAKQALERSLHICLAEGHRAITVPHLLAGLAVAGPGDPAVRLLRSLGIEPAELEAAVRRHWHAA